MFKKYSAIALSLMLAAIAASTFLTAEKSNTGKINGEFINPGAPFSPTGLGDWFKTGIEDSENPELSEVLSRVRYSILLRSQGGQLVVPTRIFVQPQSLAPDGRIVEGFSFCYGDRIQLMVDPVSAPLDIQELVSEEFTPNTRGEAKVHFKTQVRGVEGASREAGIQKWESGIENHYPSTMQWTVKGEGDIPYILYTLAGDLPVAELKEMAASLVRVEKGNIKPNND